MATRKKSSSRRRGAGGSNAFSWFAAGLILGLGLAFFLYTKGFLPDRPAKTETAERPAAGEPGLLDDDSEVISGDDASQYDFFTVLPEMEVVVPERELADPEPASGIATEEPEADQFILQAGSFRSAADADELKARLALLGSVASIQQVTVDDQTWHRVRIGPVRGARQADQLRRQLQDSGIEVLVLKANG